MVVSPALSFHLSSLLAYFYPLPLLCPVFCHSPHRHYINADCTHYNSWLIETFILSSEKRIDLTGEEWRRVTIGASTLLLPPWECIIILNGTAIWDDIPLFPSSPPEYLHPSTIHPMCDLFHPIWSSTSHYNAYYGIQVYTFVSLI